MRPIAAFVLIVSAVAQTRAQSASTCRVSRQVLPLRELPEASGIAASRRTPGVLWSHNDAGLPILYALTTEGAVQARIRVTGARVGDWESVSVGPCPQGTCVYIGDIGDNYAKRREITIYRVPEPDTNATVTASAESLGASYPDGPRDAEALFVLPNEAVFVVTKGEKGAVALYRIPSPFRNGAHVQLERVATLVAPGPNQVGVADRRKVTGAAASADGRWVALRTGTAITFYAAGELIAGKVREVFRYDVTRVREPQGEGVALGADGAVWLAGEGGGKSRPGTLARLDCTFP